MYIDEKATTNYPCNLKLYIFTIVFPNMPKQFPIKG